MAKKMEQTTLTPAPHLSDVVAVERARHSKCPQCLGVVRAERRRQGAHQVKTPLSAQLRNCRICGRYFKPTTGLQRRCTRLACVKRANLGKGWAA